MFSFIKTPSFIKTFLFTLSLVAKHDGKRRRVLYDQFLFLFHFDNLILCISAIYTPLLSFQLERNKRARPKETLFLTIATSRVACLCAVPRHFFFVYLVSLKRNPISANEIPRKVSTACSTFARPADVAVLSSPLFLALVFFHPFFHVRVPRHFRGPKTGSPFKKARCY